MGRKTNFRIRCISFRSQNPTAQRDDDCNRVSSKMTISMQKSKKCKKKVGHLLNLKSHIGCAACLRLEAKIVHLKA